VATPTGGKPGAHPVATQPLVHSAECSAVTDKSNKPPAAPPIVAAMVVSGITNVHGEPEFAIPIEILECWTATGDPGLPLLRPDAPGFMPLTAAAHWIASEGGKRSIGADTSLWQAAYMQLLSSAQIYGVPRDGATPKPIPKEIFAGLPISYPSYIEVERGLDFGDRAFLECQPCFEDQSGLDPDGDRIFERGTGSPPIWTRLYVDNAAVAQICPVPLGSEITTATAGTNVETGGDAAGVSAGAAVQAGGATVAAVPATGGRPTDRDRVIAEAKRRIRHESETVPGTLAAFARQIHEWLDKQPKAIRVSKTGKVMTADTIEGHIRKLWDARRG
jgi:hypothetical protein